MFTLLLLTLNLGFGHDIQMAIFEIYEGRDGLEMTVSIDKEDFLRTLATEFASEYSAARIGELAFEYLDSKMAVKVNGECTSFKISEIEYGNLNIHLKGSLNLNVEQVKEVSINNTCMIDLFEDHDNIIKLKLNNRSRSFRLNKDRTSTIALYE